MPNRRVSGCINVLAVVWALGAVRRDPAVVFDVRRLRPAGGEVRGVGLDSTNAERARACPPRLSRSPVRAPLTWFQEGVEEAAAAACQALCGRPLLLPRSNRTFPNATGIGAPKARLDACRKGGQGAPDECSTGTETQRLLCHSAAGVSRLGGVAGAAARRPG